MLTAEVLSRYFSMRHNPALLVVTGNPISDGKHSLNVR